MYLPPATPAEAHAVYSLLHVTRSAVRLERTYDNLYFGSTFLHLIVRLAFLATGLSASFRNYANTLAGKLTRLGLFERICGFLSRGINGIRRWKWADFALSAAIRTWLGRSLINAIGQWQPLLFRTVLIYYLLYSLFFTLFWSPLIWYEGFVLPHQYGLSHQPFGSWLEDTARDTGVDAVVGAVSAAIIVWGIFLYPKRWARVFALWAAPVILISIFLDPLFDRIDNRFTPLPVSSPLYAPLHQLAARAGVPHAQILVADKSKQTDETNAYVTGLGSSAQIVLWDTLIQRMKTDEIVAICGHELGHYVEHHVIIGGALGALSMFLFLPAMKYCSDFLCSRFGKRWQITSLADPAALPILLISLSVLSFIVSPLTNFASRIIEHRADSFGLAVTGNRVAMATALVELANENLTDPYPPKWEVFWLEDHPPFGERINFALYGRPLTLRR